mmetsp:Transcript_70287/g.150512  ORF Transcript_70287/g.150512 Transcript_70287/m.150512 type:complete len:1114 (-) Transcript_70287:73-3414(-)
MGGKISTQVRPVRPDQGEDEAETGDGTTPVMQSRRSLRDSAQRDSVAGGGRGRSEVEPSGTKGIRVHVQGAGYELEDRDGTRKKLSNDVVSWFQGRNGDTLQGSIAFVPWILQQSYFEGNVEEGKIVVHRGQGAVVFSDASGFTALTERLAKKSNGAELLSQCLTSFFTPLINLINAYRGDVIKFSGDALTIYFPAVDDTQGPRTRFQMPPHGSYGLPDLGAMATSVLRACACCIEIHKRLHMFDTGVDDVRLCLHIGVGCGQVSILQVGGVVPPETHVPRSEYLLAGPPLEQISIAEPLAKNGETCVSPQAWDYVNGCVVEDTSRTLDDRPDFHLLLKMEESKYTFPTVKYSAMETDKRHEKQFKLSELSILRRYIPSSVFKQIEGGTLTYVNEMRNISTIFISGSGVDASTDEGANAAQDLMSSIQRICYANEGTLNKFVIDDKGMLFLLVYGLPPLVHTDDPTRAVLGCFDMIKVFQRLGLEGRFGVTTGRAYCGVCGSASRMEYTVLGDVINLSARLMANAPKDGVLVDEATASLSTREVKYRALNPIKVKGKANPIPILTPYLPEAAEQIGVVDGTVHFPWHERPMSMSQQSMDRQELAEQFRSNVNLLCALTDWAGADKAHQLLGGKFNEDLHKEGSQSWTARTSPKLRAPAGSPFSEGGAVVIAGSTGLGKIELAEHMVAFSCYHLHMLPVFGTMGPRLNKVENIAVELLRSSVAAFRHMDKSLPADDIEALPRCLPSISPSSMAEVKEAFGGQALEERRDTLLKSLTDLVVALLEVLRERTGIIVTLQLECGTSLFPKTLETFNCFWTVVNSLAKVAMPEGGAVPEKPVVLCVIAQEVERSNATVKMATGKGWLVNLTSLTDENCIEYMAKYLKVGPDLLPKPLREFTAKISLGNPLYIRETVEQLLLHEHISVKLNAEGEAESVQYNEDLEGINIASWHQTLMVGETVCTLESLDPLEAAVLKMSTIFTGAFTLPDLASSSCSRWAGSTHFDFLRLFRALQDLVKRGLIETAPARRRSATLNNDPLTGKPAVATAGLQTFETRNVLIRKVGGSMVLEAQKKVVKRQALIDRALSRDLPARMDEVFSKRLEPHIPWYYENVLAKP